MIEGYIGRPGSGKSYTLTARALEEAEKRPVFANYALKHPNVWLFGPEDLLDLPPGLIVIDEAHLWFPARQALRLPPSWLALLSQTRKRGWDMLWCAQHEKRVDSVVRDVTSWLWLCSAWKVLGSQPRIFRSDCYEPERFRNPKAKMYSQTRWFSQPVADAYDTFESLTIAEHTESKSDTYARKAKTQRGQQRRPEPTEVVEVEVG